MGDQYTGAFYPTPEFLSRPNGEPSRLNPYSLCSSGNARRFVQNGPPSQNFYGSPQQPSYQSEHDEFIPPRMDHHLPFCHPLHPGKFCAEHAPTMSNGQGPFRPNGFSPQPWEPLDQLSCDSDPEVMEVVDLDTDSSSVMSSSSDISSGDDEEPSVEPPYIEVDVSETDEQDEQDCDTALPCKEGGKETGCPSLQEVDGIEKGCPSLQEVDGIEKGCPSLKEVDGIEKGCPSLEEVDGKEKGCPSLQEVDGIEKGCPSLEEVDGKEKGCPSLQEVDGTEKGCPSLQEVDGKEKGCPSLQEVDGKEEGCPSLKEVDTLNPGSQNKPSCSSSTEAVALSQPRLAPRPIWPLPEGPIRRDPEVFKLQPLLESKKNVRRYARWLRSNRRAERRLKRQKARDALLETIILPDDTSSDASNIEMAIPIPTGGTTPTIAPSAGSQSTTSTSEQPTAQPSEQPTAQPSEQPTAQPRGSEQSAPISALEEAEPSDNNIARRSTERLMEWDSDLDLDLEVLTPAEEMSGSGGDKDD